MNSVFSIRIAWKKIPDSRVTGHIKSIKEKLTELANKNNRIAKEHLNGNECVYVYGACGSCGEDQYLVEAYCNGDGTGQPDFTWCESC